MAMGKFIILVAVLVLLFVPAAFTDDGVIINLEMSPCPWADIHLDERLGLYLSAVTGVPIIQMDLVDSLPYNYDTFETFSDLIQRGRSLGGRFLIDIVVDRIDLERRKVTVIPLVVFRYRVFAVLTGKLRIVDIKKERLVSMKKIRYEVKAADQWQFADDDPDDPALMVPAHKKALLFKSLDEKAARGLFDEIKKMTRGVFFGG